MSDLTDPKQIAMYYKHSYDRNPLFADLPLGTVITEEMRGERLRNPLRFPYRKFSCSICGEVLEYAGSRQLWNNITGENTGLQYLFYCKGCNANVEYTMLEKQ